MGWRLHDVLDTEIKDAQQTIEKNAKLAMQEVRDRSLAELDKAVASLEGDYAKQIFTLSKDAELLMREVDPSSVRAYAAYWQSALETEQAAVRRGAARKLQAGVKSKE